MKPKKLLSKVKNTIVGFILFYTNRKQIVLILSSMRCGSTLFKALLAEAPQIDHLNEKSFHHSGNRYELYYKFHRLAASPIVLIKRPSFLFNYQSYPKLPNLPLKVIVLVRNPLDTIRSIQDMMEKRQKSQKSIQQLIDYWLGTYQNILSRVEQQGAPHHWVRYVDLIAQPEKVTKRVFEFLDLPQQPGVHSYRKPLSGEWSWGKDDGGEKIKSLKIIKEKKSYEQAETLIRAIQEHEALQSFMDKHHISLPNTHRQNRTSPVKTEKGPQ